MKTLFALFISALTCQAQLSINGLGAISGTAGVQFGAAQNVSLLDSLSDYWKLDETSGNRNDSTASAQNLTDNNGVTPETGKINTAAGFIFDDVSYLSHADSAALSLSTDTDFTWTFWLKIISDTGFDQPLIMKGSGGTAAEYEIKYVNGLFLRMTVGNGSDSKTVDATGFGNLAFGNWYFVACTHDSVSDTISIRIGTGSTLSPADTASWSGGTQDGSSAFNMGKDPGGSTRAEAIMDEVGFWKRLLTSAEITSLFNSGNGLAYPF